MYLNLLIISLCASLFSVHGMEIAELQSHLLLNHPLFQASQLKKASLLESANSVSSLPNPSIKIGIFPGDLVTRNGPVKSRFSASQAIPNPATLKWKRKGMNALASVEKFNEKFLRFEAIRELKIAYFEYWHLKKSIEIVQDSLDLSKTWADLIKAHYSYHNYLYPTLINLQIETLKLENQIQSLESKRAVLSDQILNLAWLPGDEPLPWPTWSREVEEPPGLEVLKIEKSPKLLMLDARLESQETRVELNRSRDSFSYQVGLEWSQITSDGFGTDPGKDSWMISAGAEIPLQRKAIHSRIKAEQLQKLALQQERQVLLRELTTTQQEYLVTLVDSIREIMLIQDNLLPKISEAMNSLKSTYQTGDVDYFSLLENLRLELKLNLDIAHHQRNYWQTLAKLEALCGTSLFKETRDLTPEQDTE